MMTPIVFLLRTLAVYEDLVMDPLRVLFIFILSLVLLGLLEVVGHDAWLAWLYVLQLISQVYICILFLFLLFNILLSLTSKRKKSR